MACHETSFVEVVEKIRAPPNSLLEWSAEQAIEQLSVRRSDPEACLAAIEDAAQQPDRVQPDSDLQILVANVTSWRKEVSTWMVKDQPDVIMLQETHVTEKQQGDMMTVAYKAGYSAWSLPAHPTKGGHNMGGLLLATRKDRNFWLMRSYGFEGKGYLAVTGRAGGRDVVLVTVYLETGMGLHGGHNPTLLGDLMAFLKGLTVPWLVLGDFNIPVEEMDSTSILTEVQGAVVCTGNATTLQGGELDYGWVSRALQDSVSVREDWEVPFRPHCALKVALQVGDFRAHVLQATYFQRQVDPHPMPFETTQGHRDPALLLEPQCTKEVTTSFADFTVRVEASLHPNCKGGRGLEVTAKVGPIMPPKPTGYVWTGGPAKYWGRLAVLHKKGVKQGLSMKARQILQHHLQQVQEQWGELAGYTLEYAAAELVSQCGLPGPHSTRVSGIIEAQRKHHLHLHHSFGAAQYQQWLEGASQGGLRPLFRNLSKHEAHVTRPYTDLALEIRPHARRKHWAALWRPGGDSPTQGTEARAALQRAARLQAQQLEAITPEKLSKAFAKLPAKAPGPDGWSYEMLKAMPEEACAELADHLRRWEVEASFPQHIDLTQYAMLAKSQEAERPIGLTHVLHRVFCKMRWDLIREWEKDYGPQSPWNQAKAGNSSLDTALRRVLRAELSKREGQATITLLLDLTSFYETVPHQVLLLKGVEHHFPALLLERALSCYEGSRYIEAQGALSRPVRATRGLIAGCPLAPALSRVILHDPVAKAYRRPTTTNVDLWIDDCSVDTVDSRVERAAAAAFECYKELKQDLEAQRLQVSTTKTVFVCSSHAAGKAITGLVGPDGPKVVGVGKDLGLDSAAGSRRRITTARGRHQKGAQRAAQLERLKIGKVGIKVRLYKGSILSSALYGHEGVGVAPKRRKWFRGLLAQVLGRPNNASVSATLDFHGDKVEDPWYTILAQHFKAVRRLLLHWPAADRARVQQGWCRLVEWLKAAEHPWKRASGPLGACYCYLRELGWEAITVQTWRIGARIYDLLEPADFHEILFLAKRSVSAKRHSDLAAIDGGNGLHNGPDWTVPRRLLSKAKGLKGVALKAIWQGAVRASPLATCQRCGVPATKRHVLWDCQWWQQHGEPEPDWWPSREDQSYPACLWDFGLLPRNPSWPECQHVQDEEIELHGVLKDGGSVPPGVFAATDATGGPSNDPRTREVVWGIVLFTWQDGAPSSIGSATGRLKNEQSVYRGEARAIQFAAEHLEPETDVTSDCKGAVLRSRKGTQTTGRHSDIYGVAPTEGLDLHWVPSHLNADQFRDKLGPGQDWRRIINDEVDRLVGARVGEIYSKPREKDLLRADQLAESVALFLGRRMEALIGYDKDQGPQVVFPRQLKEVASVELTSQSASRSSIRKRKKTNGAQPRPRAKDGTGREPAAEMDGQLAAGSPRAGPGSPVQVSSPGSAPRAGPSPDDVEAPDPGTTSSNPQPRAGQLLTEAHLAQGAGKAAAEDHPAASHPPERNKKQTLLALVAGAINTKGHHFSVTGAQTGHNFQIKCVKCGLWIQQNDAKATFDRKWGNFCAGHPDSSPAQEWAWHPSHDMKNEGIRWRCARCFSVQPVGGLATPAEEGGSLWAKEKESRPKVVEAKAAPAVEGWAFVRQSLAHPPHRAPDSESYEYYSEEEEERSRSPRAVLPGLAPKKGRKAERSRTPTGDQARTALDGGDDKACDVEAPTSPVDPKAVSSSESEGPTEAAAPAGPVEEGGTTHPEAKKEEPKAEVQPQKEVEHSQVPVKGRELKEEPTASRGPDKGESPDVLPVWPVTAGDQPLQLYAPGLQRTKNKEHWLSQVGEVFHLKGYLGDFRLLGVGGSRAVMEAPGDPSLCWKITASDLPPTRRSGHGPELALGQAVPGIFGSRTRMVGPAVLQIGSWGSLGTLILEMEKVAPMYREPSSCRILHMAAVLLGISCAGITCRDVNRHNWGIRKTSEDSYLEEFVLVDGGEFELQPEPPIFPPKRKIESWWTWVNRTDPQTAGWLKQQIDSHYADHRQLAKNLVNKLNESEAGHWVVVALFQQKVLHLNPRGETCLAMSRSNAIISGDWTLLSLSDQTLGAGTHQ
ncbi:unnamed protein product [Symbiodinium sp. CCMP2456]|nr:unnamed protein product [Symbiodinium sp. CCMP2456]